MGRLTYPLLARRKHTLTYEPQHTDDIEIKYDAKLAKSITATLGKHVQVDLFSTIVHRSIHSFNRSPVLLHTMQPPRMANLGGLILVVVVDLVVPAVIWSVI